MQPQLVTFLAQSQSDVLVQKSDKTKVQRPPVLCKICRKINLSEIDQQRVAADTSQSCVGGRKGKIFIHCLKCPFNFVTGSTTTAGYLRSQVYWTCFSLFLPLPVSRLVRVRRFYENISWTFFTVSLKNTRQWGKNLMYIVAVMSSYMMSFKAIQNNITVVTVL